MDAADAKSRSSYIGCWQRGRVSRDAHLLRRILRYNRFRPCPTTSTAAPRCPMLFGLFSPKLLLPIREKAWVEVRMQWLARQFGIDRLLKAEVVVPADGWFPGIRRHGRRCPPPLGSPCWFHADRPVVDPDQSLRGRGNMQRCMPMPARGAPPDRRPTRRLATVGRCLVPRIGASDVGRPQPVCKTTAMPNGWPICCQSTWGSAYSWLTPRCERSAITTGGIATGRSAARAA